MYRLKSARSRVKSGFSQQNTKHGNTMLLFNLIRKNSPLSRIMLSDMTGLSATTVSMLVEDLMLNELVMEIGTVDSNLRGRRPIMLQLNRDGGYVGVVEVINTGLNCYLYNLVCECVDKAYFRYNQDPVKGNVVLKIL